MRVLQINAVYNLSSTGRTTTELHKALLEKGHESYVAYSKSNKPDDENLYKIGSLLDCKIHALLSRITGKQGYYSHIPTLKLLKYMDKIKPDIVHLRNLHGNYINIPMLLKYLAKNRISTVITLHDFFLLRENVFTSFQVSVTSGSLTAKNVRIWITAILHGCLTVHLKCSGTKKSFCQQYLI